MTTVWRPKVRIPVPNIDGADVDEKRRDESTTKGTKRKRAPPTKGPCEHGVKPRSRCKVCSACPHGRQRSNARSAVGHHSVSTVVSALSARSAVGQAFCEHGRRRSQCKECGGCIILRARSSALNARSAVGQESASTVVSAISARSAVVHQSASTVVGALLQGVRWVTNLRARSSAHDTARSAVGQYASTVVGALMQGVRWVKYASTVVGALISICEHGRRAKQCGGSSNLRARSSAHGCKQCPSGK